MCDFEMIKGRPYPMGASLIDKGVNLAVAVKPGRALTLCLYSIEDGHRTKRVDIPEEFRIGDVYAFVIRGLDLKKYTYSFHDGGKMFCDPYSVGLYGCEKWGVRREKSMFPESDDFDWEKDRFPHLPLEDTIMYTLHVRGFTRHSSSGVKNRGYFEGIIEKIPYIKELGVNQIELMPAYDFNEIISVPDIYVRSEHIPAESVEAKALQETLRREKRAQKKNSINYWGYSDDAYYFAPKAAYSATGVPMRSMKELVKALHREGIELIMQFYFPEGTLPQLIVNCVRFWVMEYHIDGACLMGPKIPAQSILSDPVLADTKLYMRDLSALGKDRRRNTALVQDGFMYDMRRYLKSDEDMLRSFVSHQLDNPVSHGVVNFITNYYGFTLMDLVSYDRKHNEENGEDNRDGTDYNFSWNCGVEGRSRRKYTRLLRRRQIYNALSFLFLSAGIPKLMAGDEFGNSQNGNNNAYNQDNATTWLDWKDAQRNEDILAFVKQMILMRKKSPLLRQAHPKSLSDRNAVGYPEVSYHGEQAWYPHYENYSRCIGCMYTGRDEFMFTAYNMYWIEENFALPKLPKDKKWYVVMKSSEGFVYETEPLEDQEKILVPGRTVVILTGR